jgi:hypothetical protein
MSGDPQWARHVESRQSLRQCNSSLRPPSRQLQIHWPPSPEPINWVCRRGRKVVKHPIHQVVPPIAHQSSPISDFPQIGPKHRTLWPRRGQRVSGPFMSSGSSFQYARVLLILSDPSNWARIHWIIRNISVSPFVALSPWVGWCRARIQQSSGGK